MGKTVTFLVGNGLGRAINNESFDLAFAAEKVWNDERIISNEIKKIIQQYVEIDSFQEENLERIQDVFFKLVSIEEDMTSFHGELKTKLCSTIEYIRELKKDYLSFLFHVAAYFYNIQSEFEKEKIDSFILNFVQYIQKLNNEGHTVHVATTNYDRLLYHGFLRLGDLFIEENFKPIFSKNYDNTCLVDGLIDKGFSAENLIPKYGNKFGWYLHLHGSPLFYTEDDKIYKEKSSYNKVTLNEKQKHHIILCHPKQKPNFIKHSYILQTYNYFFKKAIIESDLIILFGYGKKDAYINDFIKENKNEKCKLISIDYAQEAEEWKKELPKENPMETDHGFVNKDITSFDFNQLMEFLI